MIFRSYEKPDPPLRCTLDAISKLISTIQRSLQAGIIRQCTFTTEFPKHVFKYLFDNKGSTVPRRPEKLYDRADFISPYFVDDNFVHYNKHGEGFKVVFPIRMHSYIRFSSQSYDHKHNPLPRTFNEVISVKIIKCRSR